MNLFQKAAANLNLTPGERALLKTLQSLLITAIIAGLIAGATYLNNPEPINWQHLGYIVIIAIVFSFAHGIAKFITAQGDTPLGVAIESVVEGVEKRLPATDSQKPPAS
jgi:uncharacterized membrane protein